jgi:hypothetical protein
LVFFFLTPISQCRFCLTALKGFRGSVWRPLSRLRSAERRAVARRAVAAVRARYADGRRVMRVVHREDRRK